MTSDEVSVQVIKFFVRFCVAYVRRESLKNFIYEIPQQSCLVKNAIKIIFCMNTAQTTVKSIRLFICLEAVSSPVIKVGDCLVGRGLTK